MLKKESIEAFAKFAGVSVSELETKIKSESEEDISLREVQVFTNDELETRIKNEKTTSYTEGKDAGVEMLVKAKKKELGYEFEGKGLDSLFEHHTNKIKAANGKPDERITELENDIKNINSTHAALISTMETDFNAVQSKYNGSVINNELLSIIPEGTTISKRDFITLFNSEYQVLKEDGKTIVKQNGETMKDDKTASPLGLKDVVLNYGTERKYITATGGRGRGNESGASGIVTNSLSKFQSTWQKQNEGKSLNSADYQKDYTAWRKENTEVVA